MKLRSEDGNREPDVISQLDTEKNLSYYLGENISEHDFLVELEKSFNEMVASVEKYGGFYIGRYETGDLDKSIPLVVKGNKDISYESWYSVYEESKKLKKENNNVETGMIWGCQFDATLKFLIESGNKTCEDMVDSTSWGNHLNSEFQYDLGGGYTDTKGLNSKVIIPTGSAEYTNANNIYDFAGNVYDGTMEADSDNKRMWSGGFYQYAGSRHAAGTHATGDPNKYLQYLGYRSMMYVK